MAVSTITTLDAPTQVTPEEAIETIWEHVANGEGHVREVARALWPSLTFTKADLEYLALYGLSELAEKEKRDAAQSNRPMVAFASPHGRKWHDYLNILTVPYQDAADNPKPLLRFTTEDLAALATRFRGVAHSYIRRANWASATSGLLNEHGVDCVDKLPAAVLKSVAENAKDAFSRVEE